MDFLHGLKEALAHGITREEYTDIWNKEMELKLCNNIKQNIVSKGVSSVDMKEDEAFAAKDPAMPLLKQIAEKQDMVQHQQNGIQQQLKHLQTLHVTEQQRLLQLFGESRKGMSEKFQALETSLAKLELTFTECVKKTVLSESLDIQEMLSIKTETFYNHILEEMRKTTSDRKTGDKAEKNEVIADKQSQMSQEIAATDIKAIFDKDLNDDSSSADTICGNNSDEKLEVPLIETQTDASGARNVGSTSDNENPNVLKDTLHSELSEFLVNVQELLLRPINPDYVRCHIIDRIEELLQSETSLISEQLVKQSAVSAAVQARLCKVETCFKNDISKIMSILKLNEQSNVKMDLVVEEIEKIKTFLSCELPSKIMSHPKWASMFAKRSYVNVGEATLSESGTSTAVRNDQDESSHIDKYGRNKNRCIAGGEDTQYCSGESDSDQVHNIMLILSISALILLTGYDAKARKGTPRTPQPRKTKDFFLYSDTSDEHTQSEARETKKKLGSQEKTALRDLTDDHMQLMFGQHKQAHFLCELNYSEFSADVINCYKLKDIAPGYKLQIKVFKGENNNLNFYIQAISTTLDDSLLWPADFTITIALVNTKALASSKQHQWHTFTKSKSLFKPLKALGHSNYIPFCFFRDDVVNKFVYDGTLTFEIFVKYTGREEDTQESDSELSE